MSEENQVEKVESQKQEADKISTADIKTSEAKKEDNNKYAGKSDEEIIALQKKEKQKESKSDKQMNDYKVLIIDDDRWVQRIFAQYLNSWGFKHISASNSFKGLELAIKEQPLMIFLDIIMPDVTGDITIKFLKNIEATKKIPVVIISGNLNKEVLKNTYKDGAGGFITKPFTKEVLEEKLLTTIDKELIKTMLKDGKMPESVMTKKYIQA